MNHTSRSVAVFAAMAAILTVALGATLSGGDSPEAAVSAVEGEHPPATRGPILAAPLVFLDMDEQFAIEQDRLAVEAYLAAEAARIEAERVEAERIEAERREQERQRQQAIQQSTPRPAPVAVERPVVSDGDIWWKLAMCECGGNPGCNTGNGYYGTFQFTLGTWQSVGGSGYPHEHSYEEQLLRAQILQARSGWGQWPACARSLGLL